MRERLELKTFIKSIVYNMNRFTIEANDFLNCDIEAFYHSDYSGGGQWKIDGTIENIICTLKNDITTYSENILQNTSLQLANILRNDLPEILRITQKNNLVVCVVPRAKVNYRQNQLYFKNTVSVVVDRLDGFTNGTNNITRCIDTQTTHRAKWGFGGNGNLPYPNITNDTCRINDSVINKDILLIDDLYTRTINIDEDAIQALLEKGARSVFFYSIGKTRSRNDIIQNINPNNNIGDLPF